MQILGCLGILAFVILFMVLGALRNIYRAAFGNPSDTRRRASRRGQQFDADYKQAKGTSYSRRQRKSGDNRVFPDNVGEYVDFEEL